jgi:hypothetical protein
VGLAIDSAATAAVRYLTRWRGSQATALELTTAFFGRLFLEKRETREDIELAVLKNAIQAGIESGPGVPAQEVFDRLEKKYATTEGSGNG